MTKTTIETVSGKVVEPTRADLARAIKGLPDGFHDVVFKQVRRGYTSTRYKYYFGHVLETILGTCAQFFQVFENDQARPTANTDEIHEVLKLKYNPVMVRAPFGMYVVSNSTTNLSDRDFIARFEEAIIIEFSEPPYGCDFMSREEYAAMMKSKKNNI